MPQGACTWASCQKVCTNHAATEHTHTHTHTHTKQNKRTKQTIKKKIASNGRIEQLAQRKQQSKHSAGAVTTTAATVKCPPLRNQMPPVAQTFAISKRRIEPLPAPAAPEGKVERSRGRER